MVEDRRAAFVYEDKLSQHVLRPDHPFRPVRLRHVFDLLQAYEAFNEPNSRLVHPRTATDEDLTLIHKRDYVNAVRTYSATGAEDRLANRYGFSMMGDNPIYKGMFEANNLAVGATMEAARLVISGESDRAFSPAGGLHHAMPERASGFCVFNDAAIAIEWMQRQGLRVAYVDIDAHHGDGVERAFYETDQVLTVSIHESGRYLFPGTGSADDIGTGRGRGYAVNLPLEPYTDDDIYLWLLETAVMPLVQAFNPDVLVTQLGIDTHFSDPLTHLHLSVQGFTRAVELLSGLCPRWLALGGGGYAPDAVARGWAQAYGVMLQRQWPERIPDSMRTVCGDNVDDLQVPRIDRLMHERVRRGAEEAALVVKRNVFPIHSIS